MMHVVFCNADVICTIAACNIAFCNAVLFASCILQRRAYCTIAPRFRAFCNAVPFARCILHCRCILHDCRIQRCKMHDCPPPLHFARSPPHRLPTGQWRHIGRGPWSQPNWVPAGYCLTVARTNRPKLGCLCKICLKFAVAFLSDEQRTTRACTR